MGGRFEPGSLLCSTPYILPLGNRAADSNLLVYTLKYVCHFCCVTVVFTYMYNTESHEASA